MPTLGTIVTVLISGPSDVSSAKGIVRNAVLRWNELNAMGRKVALVPWMYERDATPRMGMPAQAIINEQIVNRCDIALALFWTRLGTPTVSAPSGTAEEIDVCVTAGKPVTVYFQQANVNPDTFDVTEYERLKGYREDCRSKGLLASYSSEEDLSDQVVRHLSTHVDAVMSSLESSPPSVQLTVESQVSEQLSSEISSEPSRDPDYDKEQFGAAMALLRAGDYESGFKPFLASFQGVEKQEVIAELEAVGRMWAANAGSETAFRDLADQAATQGDLAEVQISYARALETRDELSKAIAVLDAAIASPQISSDLVGRLFYHKAQLRAKVAGGGEGARSVLLEGLSRDLGRSGRVLLLEALSLTYSPASPGVDQLQHLAFRELEFETNPLTSDRLNFGFEYSSKIRSHGLALLHYRRVLDREPNNAQAQNNAGWASSELGLRLTSGQYFSKAIQSNEPYAIANLGFRLLEAGSPEHVRGLIRGAREASVEHANIDRLAARLAEGFEQEDGKLEEILERAEQRRAELVRVGKAMLQPELSMAHVDGTYVGPAMELRLVSAASGVISGSLKFSTRDAAPITGTIHGAVVFFDWRIPDDPAAASKNPGGLLQIASLATNGGYGFCCLVGDRAVGMFADGAPSVAAIDSDKWWKLDARRV